MERLIMGFSAFFAMFLGSFYGGGGGDDRPVTENGKAQIEYD